MWLFTTFGFFSIIQDPKTPDTLTVRARSLKDLKRFRLRFPAGTRPAIKKTPYRDYPFRFFAHRDHVADVMMQAFLDLSASNFKNEVQNVDGKGRAQLYHRVWSVMLNLQERPSEFE